MGGGIFLRLATLLLLAAVVSTFPHRGGGGIDEGGRPDLEGFRKHDHPGGFGGGNNYPIMSPKSTVAPAQPEPQDTNSDALDETELDSVQAHIIAIPTNPQDEQPRIPQTQEDQKPKANNGNNGNGNNGNGKGNNGKGNNGKNENGSNEHGGNEDGGNEDGDNEDGGNEDGDNEDGGNEDGGNEDGGNEDGGNEEGGNQDGVNEDGGNEARFLCPPAPTGNGTQIALMSLGCLLMPNNFINIWGNVG